MSPDWSPDDLREPDPDVIPDFRPDWIQVSLTAEDGEMAEAVAEVLSRYIEGGIVIQSGRILEDPESEGRPAGPYRVCGYIPNDEQLSETSRKIREGMWYLGRIRPLAEPEFTPLVETNWVDAWKEHYEPLPVGRRLIVLPAWFDNPDPARTPIVIDPGMAFGTGTHPTTQLALEMLESCYASNGPHTVLDVGCGSGILSIAAARLGADKVLGVDIDAEALKNARENLDLNAVSGSVRLETGSVAQVLAGEFEMRQADLVVANIIAPVLAKLLDAGLAKLVSSGGRLVLSGMLEDQAAEIARRVEAEGRVIIERRQSGDWVALLAE